jgi:hypothetical protein
VQQVEGGGIGPLEIIQKQQEGGSLDQGLEQTGDGFK